MDYYQVLGVRRDCDVETLRRAFRELSRKHHPDNHEEGQRGNAEKRYQKICIAFNTLKNTKQRARYDKLLGRNMGPQQQRSASNEDPAVLVRKFYKAGLAKVQQGQFEQAVDCFKRAIHYQPDPEFFFQKGSAEAQVSRFRKDAVASLQKAIEMKPGQLKYHVKMVNTLVGFGLVARAKVYLEKALSHFPEEESLLEIGREIDPKKYKKGILGQIFGGRK